MLAGCCMAALANKGVCGELSGIHAYSAKGLSEIGPSPFSIGAWWIRAYQRISRQLRRQGVNTNLHPPGAKHHSGHESCPKIGHAVCLLLCPQALLDFCVFASLQASRPDSLTCRRQFRRFSFKRAICRLRLSSGVQR